MHRLAVLVFITFFPAFVFAQTTHPFTFEDMMALKRITEPVPSPDGKWVAFSATDVDLAANTNTPHVWIVPTTGGQEREVISGQDADRPRWSSDGKRFAFVSRKEGGSQIWIADFDGAAGAVTGVHKLTSIATEAEGELWSPDGRNILFVSNVYPECTDEACNARKLEEAKNSQVKALVFTRLLYRHWNAYKEGKRSHIFVIPACAGTAGCPPGAARDLTPGDYDTPPFSLGGQDDYAFSPDSQEVCYTSNHDKVEAISTNNDLWIVPVSGGGAKNITADNPASDSTPLYSPNGKYIAYRAQFRPGNESDRFRLMLYDRKTGEKKNLTEDWDRWVGSFSWAPDSSTIFFSAENAGHSPLYKVAVSGTGGITEIASGYDSDVAAVSTGGAVVYSRMATVAPNEIYITSTTPPEKPCTVERLSPPGSPIWYETAECAIAKPTRLTHLNDSILSQVAMTALQSFWFTGAHGDKVEGFILKPPDFDTNKKYPLKFIVHGGPEVPIGDEWTYRWNSELFAASGYVVIEINFHGSPGYGQKFVDAINADWGGAPYEDLMTGLDYAEKTFPFLDKDRECALGASFGGYMVNWILGHTDRFKCIVSHDGTFNNESDYGTTEELWFNEWEFRGTPYTNPDLYLKWSPHKFATKFKTPTLVVHGQLDYRLDVSEGFQLFTALQRLGVPSKMLYFPDEGHWVLKPQNSQLWYKTVNDWVNRWTEK